ncbi:flagellar biosynthesis protein FlhF [Halobacillus litoralis]|uniref:flagellar biosynthesis protein FlhF n=1 Tax=Halobacillus litoralis TaxID=45668 RepID=UPI001CD7179C|nr:flagellar biosynthesis protein FlhF [Halobacillus litoralis]MCA1023082.1 flagellar biosynthesis protein FlhF [Halobacillus litoralis]
MKIKKFHGASMPEAMEKVRNDFGADALILSSKVIKHGGFLGLFKKEMTEVVAGMDPDVHVERKKPQRPVPLPNAENNGGQQKILDELSHVKALLQKDAPESHPLSPKMDQLARYLTSRGLKEEHVQKLLSSIDEKYEPSSRKDEIKKTAVEELTVMMEELSFGHVFQKRYVHLFGPTGVGKTTTLAKLAGDAVLNKGWTVGFITTDTYRIGAVEQLKTYAAILQAPVEVAYNLDDYRKAKEKLKGVDLVFIDTAGRNYRNHTFIKDLQEIIDFEEEADHLLVLSLTSKYMDMQTIYDNFSSLPVEKIIFTKEDETSTMADGVNLMLEKRLGAAYITNGQDVPDDIQTVSAGNIASRLMKGYTDEGSS